jgi:photosystem II stability/assembly factor-like uncharacterized protein
LAVGLQSADQGWLVGKDGAIGRWLTGTLESASSPVFSDLHAVAVRSSGLAYAVGAGGKILRYDPASPPVQWVLEETAPVDLWGVAFVNDGDAWAVGDGGTILRLVTVGSARSWVPQNYLYTQAGSFRAVTALPSGAVWAVGQNGMILHRAPNGVISPGPLSLRTGW